jgi:GNAT superfamily N-acetyltransferase
MDGKVIRFKLLTEDELDGFWCLHDNYMLDDMIPDSEPPMTDEDRAWFFSPQYRTSISELFARERDTLRIAYFYLGNDFAGFIVYVTYETEDGKCFILEFCVEKSLRGIGLGEYVFKRFEHDARLRGAAYFALNASNERNRRFWTTLGFVKDGENEYGQPLYVKK